ncbi:MAG: HAD family hydrolase [Simkania negevensis]|nr:HAD family hydrolase [Simkania negevensis]
MLIIFDLDDTLIDTSGSITPHLLKNALTEMVCGGLPLTDFQRALATLQRLDAARLSLDKAVLEEFLELEGAPRKYFDMGWKVISAGPSLDYPIERIDDALEILHFLSSSHRLALVTRGSKEIQQEKMKKAGISQEIFYALHFCKENKKKSYEILGKESGILSENVLVCGDRISLDLSPAKDLGYTTVHLRWGRGLGNTGSKKDVDYTILHLRELKEIIDKVDKKN